MRLGVMILPEKTWPENAGRWRTVDALGYDSAWVYDHMWWRGLRDSAWFSPIPVLAAAAAVTDRVRIGLMVASPNFRHPVVLAKDAVAIDDISGGRFILGLGAGSPDAGDAAIIDGTALSPRDRASRFREFVELTDRLLRTPTTTHAGRFYVANDARMIPGCVQRPRVPLAIAAAAPGSLAVAARSGDAWVTLGPTDFSRSYRPDECLAVVAAQAERLRRACDHAGRDFNELDRIFITTGWAGDPLASAASCLEVAECYARVGITHLVIHWPRESGVYAGDPEVLSLIAETALPQLRQL
jgi:alkanesulfonate monooxygenase SsuD/methylene tetrahydromethanopterin reductase-like flavin-dependent oxidoreductase (luciferase family)